MANKKIIKEKVGASEDSEVVLAFFHEYPFSVHLQMKVARSENDDKTTK